MENYPSDCRLNHSAVRLLEENFVESSYFADFPITDILLVST